MTQVEKEINQILKPVVGQEFAKTRIKRWALGAALGDGHLSPMLITGEPGKGKSLLLKKIVDILRVASSAKCGNIFHAQKGDALGSMTAFIAEIVSQYISDRDGALIVDEIQTANKSTLGFIRDLIQPQADRSPNIVKHDDMEFIYDSRKFAFVFASDRAKCLDAALLSRCEVQITLEDYTDEEIAQILFQNLSTHDIRFHEDSLLPLARTNRGTARDLVGLSNDVLGHLDIEKKRTINQEDVRTILKTRGIYPDGINKTELKILLFLENGPLQLQQIAARCGISSAEVKLHEVYLFRRGFITVDSRREITPLGSMYMRDLRKRHFIEPKIKADAF